MAVLSDSHRLILPVAPIVGAVVGICAAVLFAMVPTVAIENVSLDSGLAAIVTAAAPPLGLTARLLLVAFGGGGLGVISWFATFLVLGHRCAGIGVGRVMMDVTTSLNAPAPVLRRADAHPDAPARSPLRADRDLGARFLEVPVSPARHLDARALAAEPIPSYQGVEPVAERALPENLDQPLAAYAGPTLRHQRPATFAATERFETFTLPPTRCDPSETIHALLDRLERVVQRPAVERVAVSPQDLLEDTLAELRAMAHRAH